MNQSLFTFEELDTLFTQIEAILNSRPLIPLYSNPDDYNFLSPAHFLIGESFLALPEPSLLNVKENRLNRFEMLQHLQQQFWRHWSKDYLTTLQAKIKWTSTRGPKLKIDSLVVLKDNNAPPLLWRLGRVQELHPGSDGVLRVISVRTSTGTVKRSVTQVCELINDDDV